MDDSEPLETPRLVDGRSCGSCNVCCVALTINDRELQKLQGYRCRHAQRDNSCAIYSTRPRTCREFYCGWRQLKWIREPLRPDTSGVLVRLHWEDGEPDEKRRLGVIFTLLNRASLKAEGLAESVAAAVAADIPVFLHVPGPPGYTSGQGRINEALQHAVATKDKKELLAILRMLRDVTRKGKHERIVMSRRTASGENYQVPSPVDEAEFAKYSTSDAPPEAPPQFLEDAGTAEPLPADKVI
ncbi:MAG TPA: hypothetical protein VKS60_04985 [Stellaceae bacterium]|nr:hypothetical protein [Stellaceae bacterium]